VIADIARDREKQKLTADERGSGRAGIHRGGAEKKVGRATIGVHRKSQTLLRSRINAKNANKERQKRNRRRFAQMSADGSSKTLPRMNTD
jgi:hypothetical protein